MVAARIFRSACVGAVGQGREALDQGVGGGGRLAGHAGQAEVVDAEVHQDVGQAGNREDVAVEARQRVLADLVAQEAVSGDALVDDPSPLEAPVEEVHGAVVRAGRGADPFEPGVAERHGDRGVVRGEHVDARDVEPGFYLLGLREGGRGDVVPADDVRGLHGLVGVGGQAGLLGEVEAEEQVGAGGDGQIHRVTGGLFSRRDGESSRRRRR